MYRAKLFKNGNSVVLAIPEALRRELEWQSGDTLELHTVTSLPSLTQILVLVAIPSLHKPEKPTHARKTSNKTR